MELRNKMAVGLALMLNGTPAWPQDPLAGVYEGEQGSLKVIVDGRDVGVTVKTPRCLGSVEGYLAEMMPVSFL